MDIPRGSRSRSGTAWDKVSFVPRSGPEIPQSLQPDSEAHLFRRVKGIGHTMVPKSASSDMSSMKQTVSVSVYGVLYSQVVWPACLARERSRDCTLAVDDLTHWSSRAVWVSYRPVLHC